MTLRTEYRPGRVDERVIMEMIQKRESFVIDAIVRGAMPPSKAARMVSIHEGVMELQGGANRFRAAVQTDEGPKTLEGDVVRPHGTADVQSGPLRRWEPAVEEADQAIRFAYDNQEPHEALKTISRIWEHLDRASELAAARSRLLMGKVPEPPLAETPEWFEGQEPSLHREEEGEIPPNPLAIETARLLVRAALASVDETDDLEAEVDTGPLGRVAIDWQIPGLRLHWMVEATDLPWPSVKVYHVFRATEGGNIGPARTQIFHNAFDAVEAFVGVLRRE